MEDKIDSNLNHISYIRISKKNIEMFYFIKLKFESWKANVTYQ